MSLRNQATAGLVWTFSQQFGNQIIGFVVSVVLARLLLPAQFGLIGMVTVFIAIGTSLVDVGLTQSLIRNKEVDQEDLSTVFFFNLVGSLLIYLILFFTAPVIAEFYNQQALVDILRVLGLVFIISAFGAIQGARLTKMMNFRTLTVISIPSTVVGGIVGIVLAFNGFGVWSLVYSKITEAIVKSAQLWIYSKWSPTFIFNIEKFKEHFNFGYKLTLSGLLETIFNNIYVIVIGKYFLASQVGYYTRAQSFQKLPVSNISTALNKVTYPLFAQIQDEDSRLKRIYKQIMQSVIFLISPILIFAAVLAEPLFRFILTEKWLPAVPYFQILCVSGILYPLNAYNLNVLKVKGRSDLFLKLEIVKKALVSIGIIIAIQYGIYGLLYSQAVLSVISFFINSSYTNKFISYSLLEQLKDILPFIGFSLLAGVGILFLDHFLDSRNVNDILRIIIGSLAGILIYLPLTFFFKKAILFNLKQIILKK